MEENKIGDILIKAFSFVLIIITGYAFKRRGVFGPVPVLAPVFTGMCDGDDGLAGVVNSLCIPISIVILFFC